MQLIFSTKELIRHLWQLKTVVFLYWCLLCVVLLKLNGKKATLKTARKNTDYKFKISFNTILTYHSPAQNSTVQNSTAQVQPRTVQFSAQYNLVPSTTQCLVQPCAQYNLVPSTTQCLVQPSAQYNQVPSTTQCLVQHSAQHNLVTSTTQ